MQQQLTKQTPRASLLVGRIDAPEAAEGAAIVIVHGLREHFGRYDYGRSGCWKPVRAVVRFDHQRARRRSMGKKVWYDDRTQIIRYRSVSSKEARAQFRPAAAVFRSWGLLGSASSHQLTARPIPASWTATSCSGRLDARPRGPGIRSAVEQD